LGVFAKKKTLGSERLTNIYAKVTVLNSNIKGVKSLYWGLWKILVLQGEFRRLTFHTCDFQEDIDHIPRNGYDLEK